MKQAWELLKQNKLFSMLYIVGTGLAIAMTMVMAMVYYVKIAPVYPEVNRLNTLYLTSCKMESGTEGNKSQYQWAVSYKALQEWFYPTKNALCVSAQLDDRAFQNSYIQSADLSGDFPVKVKLTDPDFFRIYRFHFWRGVLSLPPTWQAASARLSLPMNFRVACSAPPKGWWDVRSGWTIPTTACAA